MRYVDIDDLNLPANWQERAAAALDGLRGEIAAAEATATTAGTDVGTARRTAISEGLSVPARETLWRDFAPRLAELSNGKCWYSESKNPTSDKNVDHFRPKARVQEDLAHEGYWWLAFVWRNYRYSSQWCNQRRVDRINLTSGGKGDHFPLAPGSIRAQHEHDDLDLEQVQLLDPIDPVDWTLLTFTSTGYPTPSRPQGTAEYSRATISIEIYHLHCKALVEERKSLAGRVQRIVEEMERLQPEIATNLRSLASYKRQAKDLLRLIRPTAEYSAAALAYARGAIYTLKAGEQVKRQWLDDIVNANP